MKAKAKIYRGIKFITVGDLSTSQQLLLEHNEEPERIKILVDGKVVENCIQYSEYDKWYSTVYKRSVATEDVKPEKKEEFQVSFS